MPHLTQEYLHNLLDYDAKVGTFTRKVFKGSAAQIGDIAGTKTVNGYIDIVIDSKHYYAHRLAWFWMHGKWPPGNIDHINRNKTDNRLCNLRIANKSENARNSKRRMDNTSGCTGVNWHKQRKCWRAYITIKGKRTHLGVFANKQDAIQTRKNAEREHDFLF